MESERRQRGAPCRALGRVQGIATFWAGTTRINVSSDHHAEKSTGTKHVTSLATI